MLAKSQAHAAKGRQVNALAASITQSYALDKNYQFPQSLIDF